ncbi:MAG: hypothetical protein AB7Q97_05160 [Gammaproteobacteria bacterium]
MRDAAAELLARLRYRNHSGRVIRQHRALRSYRMNARDLLQALLLPIASTLLLALAIDEIASFWNAVIRFWTARIGIVAPFDAIASGIAGRHLFTLEIPRVGGQMPGPGAMLALAGGTTAMIAAAHLALRRYPPLVYLAWAIGAIQAATLLYLQLASNPFPHTIAAHLRGGLELAAAFLFSVPWLLAFSYYVFDFGLLRKIACTTMIVGYVAAYAPIQYTLHLVLLDLGTVALMPVLFAFGGMLVHVLMFMALYGWAMSWRSRQ